MEKPKNHSVSCSSIFPYICMQAWNIKSTENLHYHISGDLPSFTLKDWQWTKMSILWFHFIGELHIIKACYNWPNTHIYTGTHSHACIMQACTQAGTHTHNMHKTHQSQSSSDIMSENGSFPLPRNISLLELYCVDHIYHRYASRQYPFLKCREKSFKKVCISKLLLSQHDHVIC